MSVESNPPTQPRIVGPTLDELVDALTAWAHPSAPFVVAGAEVTRAARLWRCRWHPIIAPVMGHPLDALQWLTSPERWFALGIVTSGSARVLTAAGQDDVATDGVSVRVGLAVTRNGDAVSRIRYPDGDEVVCRQPTGRLVDACRTALQAPH